MASRTSIAEQAIALNRFGLGARADEPAPSNPKEWLLGQLDHYEAKPAVFASARESSRIAAEYAEGRNEMQDRDRAAKLAARKELRKKGQELYQSELDMRALAALATQAPFIERLVHFWSNHFAISANKLPVTILAGAFEREAIRPHVLGRFEDMLLAVERHPAMQIFLDQVRSIGPNSPFALRAAERGVHRKPGINENLAREIMELHTLGVRSGYSQNDVTEFALALTGWSVGMQRTAAASRKPGVFTFRPRQHEPGPRTIMGKTYDQPGEGQGQAQAFLHDLSSAEATARHIATKLARHFVADEPQAPAVNRLSAAFSQSGGDLPTIYRTLIETPEAWLPQPAKFKTPWEWTISALRGLAVKNLDGIPLAPLLNQLGQPVWPPGTPAGYDDIAESWAAPGALVRRVEVAQRMAAKAGNGLDPRELAEKLFPGVLNEMTAREIGRAESAETGLALLLVSPGFQRR
jgi:uncharacterized protein (DUF1800 family)